MILALILLVILGIIFLGNVTRIAGSVLGTGSRHAAGPRLEEVTTEDNGANDKIAVLEVNGIITSRSADQGGYSLSEVIKAQLKRAEEDSKVKAVILKVDSPGGEVLASDEIYRAIADFQSDKNKPVIASMGNLAASGGYYVSAPCQWIVANDLTITGSIGVIMHTYNYRGLMNKVGLKPETYKSGKYKDMLAGDRELENIPDAERQEEERIVQSLINETYSRFTNIVAMGRANAKKANQRFGDGQQGRPLDSHWTDYADGRVLSGSEAYRLGFVDERGNFEVAYKRALAIAGIKSANLVEYPQHYDFSDIFRLFGQSQTRSVKIDIGLEPPRLQAGMLYFLLPTFAR